MANRSNFSGSVLQLHIPERWPDLSQANQPLFRWARYEGARVDRGMTLLREAKPAQNTIAVVPASRVLFVRAKLPEGRSARQEKVLAFAVEDAIGANPEDIYAFNAGASSNGQTLIGVIDRTWLKNAAGELDLQGYAPTRVVCESELVARIQEPDSKVWTVVRTPTGGFAHLGGLETIALDAPGEGPPMALNLALDERTQAGEGPTAIELYTSDGASVPDIARWSRDLAVPVVNEGTWHPDGLDARNATRGNLLAGISGRKSGDVSLLGRYKPVAILAGTIIALHGIFSAYDWWRLSSEQSQLRTTMVERFKKLFPDAQNVPNAPRQLQQKLAELRRDAGEPAADDMLALLAMVSPAIASLNAQARAVRYEKGALELDIQFKANESREVIEKSLRALGQGASKARIQINKIAPAEDGRVIASIKVSV